ncbi:hypothetical protein HDV06_006933 [Boothiomyces sp. JEL0866]|nr:hypothetical protein HDV06_006933 [Boothiomyces sp. JEL0866]
MKLSNYEIGKTIGEGAFGKVKIGKHLPSGDKVAIKIMNIEKLREMNANKKKMQEDVDKLLLQNARREACDRLRQQMPAPIGMDNNDEKVNLTKFISRVNADTDKALKFEKVPSVSDSLTSFQQEALLMMRFKHPNIIKIYKVFESPDDVYIVMAYAYNGDLASHVSKHGYLTEIEARRIFRQIISAVDFIHSSHVVHRDLKLENILLDEYCNALVTDFGLGRAFQVSDYMKTFCGTPTYSPPEMISAKPYNGTKIDIWAMGVILYAMVAGHLPFAGDTVTSVFQKIKDVDYEIPEHFSWEITALLKQILVDNPDYRINMAGLRHNRWVNLNNDYLPEHTEVMLTSKEALAKLISSVTFEHNITIYNINYHKNIEMAKNIEKFERHRRKSSTKTIVKLKRRKNISTESNSSLESSTSSLNSDNGPFNSRDSCVENPDCNNVTVGNLQNPIPLSRSRSLNEKEKSRNSRLSLRSSSNTPILMNNEEGTKDLSRELSVVGRMSRVSDKSNLEEQELSTQDIANWHFIHKPPKNIRTMKFQFRKGLISTLDPPSMFQDLHKALIELQPKFDLKFTKLSDYYRFHVELNKAVVDIELCKIWLLSIHGLKISKVGECDEFINALVRKLNCDSEIYGKINNGCEILMKLSNYSIGKTIGEGSFGKVKVGKHIPSGEKVAIKIMNIQKLLEIEEHRKKMQLEIDKVLMRKARKKVYTEALQRIKEQNSSEEIEINLANWISKVKEETSDSIIFEKEPSVDESISHFQKEVLLMMRFNHPNIVKIYKVIESTEEVYIIMAYAYGDLSSHIAKYGYLTELEARRLFRQIVSALDFIHSSNVVHRDLKLENILLDQKGNALITDFGLGRSFSRIDYMKTFCGTPAYSAPEMVSGLPYNGTKIDIWSMGIILYTMTAGDLPFIGDNVHTLFSKIQECHIEIPEHFSWELVALIKQMLVVDPEKRADTESIRNSRWINIGYPNSPEKYPVPKNDKESIAKLISSVTFEYNTTIYNINYHKNLDLEKSIENAHVRRASSITNLRRKKSASLQPSEEYLENIVSLGSNPFEQSYVRESTISNGVASKGRNYSSFKDNLSTMNIAGKHTRTSSAIEFHLNPNQMDFTSRELSVIHRMSNASEGSFPCELQLNFKEIKEWHTIHKPPKRIRSMKFQFKQGLFSSRDPPAMFQDLHRVLVEMKDIFDLKISKLEDYYLFHVELGNVAIDIELCKIWLLNLHGLKISKNGNAAEFINTLISKLGW